MNHFNSLLEVPYEVTFQILIILFLLYSNNLNRKKINKTYSCLSIFHFKLFVLKECGFTSHTKCSDTSITMSCRDKPVLASNQ